MKRERIALRLDPATRTDAVADLHLAQLCQDGRGSCCDDATGGAAGFRDRLTRQIAHPAQPAWHKGAYGVVMA